MFFRPVCSRSAYSRATDTLFKFTLVSQQKHQRTCFAIKRETQRGRSRVSQDRSAAEAFNGAGRPSAGALQDGRDVKAGARGGDGNPRD